MKLEEAQSVANDFSETFKNYYDRIEIVGSIRRKQAEVNDIDIVIIPKVFGEYHGVKVDALEEIQSLIDEIDNTGREEAKKLGRSGISRFSSGQKIKRFRMLGVMIDLYIATPETFSCLVLIRTGSEQHNIKLTTEAQKRGLKLFANGLGLCKTEMRLGKEVIVETHQTTEEGILNELLGIVPAPEARN